MKKLIIDTDLGCDVDDAAALAAAGILQRGGKCLTQAVTHCRGSAEGAACIETLAGYYGVNFPIGLTKGAEGTENQGKARNQQPPRRKAYSDSLALISQFLERAEAGALTFVCIGQLNTLAGVLKNERLKKLLYEKAREIVIMGGNFAGYGEYYEFGNKKWTGEFNIITDLPAARLVASEKQLPLSFVDFNQGLDVIVRADKIGERGKNPVRDIYENARFSSRPSWDVVAVLYASGVFEENFFVSGEGVVTIGREGKTTFSAGGGRHRLVTLQASHEKFGLEIEKLLMEEKIS